MFFRAALTVVPMLVIAGCDDSPSGPTTGDAVTITAGVAVTNISGGSNSRKLYRITVPSGAPALTVATHGGSGDVDVLVRRGRVPTLVASDCESFNDDNDDGCSILSPTAGDYYILLYGAGDEGYTGTTLIATLTAPT
jgi:serine protease